jgi:hypothetical protein
MDDFIINFCQSNDNLINILYFDGFVGLSDLDEGVARLYELQTPTVLKINQSKIVITIDYGSDLDLLYKMEDTKFYICLEDYIEYDIFNSMIKQIKLAKQRLIQIIDLVNICHINKNVNQIII